MDEGLLGEGNKQHGHPTTAGPGAVSTAPCLRAKEQQQHLGTCSALCTQVQHVSITSELPAAMSIKPFSYLCKISEEFASFYRCALCPKTLQHHTDFLGLFQGTHPEA